MLQVMQCPCFAAVAWHGAPRTRALRFRPPPSGCALRGMHAFVDVAQGGHQDAETLLGNGVSRR